MRSKALILYIPVIHKGYLDFLEKTKKEVSEIYIINKELQEELSEREPTIEVIATEKVRDLLGKLGFEKISILSKDNIKNLKGKELVLIQDEISRKLCDKYFEGEKVRWESVFLRWDKEKILTELPANIIKKSENFFDVRMMKEAYKEAEKSGDWWRQVGAILVRGKKIIARSYNQGVPDDNTPYQIGSMRDFFKAGEKQEFSSTIHAEQKLIAEAAKAGIKLEGTTLYLTHFPCSLCAKFITWSGIGKLFFTEGASNLDGKNTMESAGVEIIHISSNFL